LPENSNQNFVFFRKSRDRVYVAESDAIGDVDDSALIKEKLHFLPIFFKFQFRCIYFINLNQILQMLDRVVIFTGYSY